MEKLAWEYTDKIRSAEKGIVSRVGTICTNLYGLTKDDDKFTEQIAKIKEQSQEFETLSKKKRKRQISTCKVILE